MADFECDTDKLREDGKDIKSLISDYNTQIDNFFRELDNLALNKVWTGTNSDLYRKMVAGEKSMYTDFGEGIKAIGQEMIDYADDLDIEVRNNEDEYDD